MVETTQFQNSPVRMSIIRFDALNKEEIFLIYTEGRENGPRIKRTGMAPPFMQRIKPIFPGETTTDPFGQRLGSWLISENLRDSDKIEVQSALIDSLQEKSALEGRFIRLMRARINDLIVKSSQKEEQRIQEFKDLINKSKENIKKAKMEIKNLPKMPDAKNKAFGRIVKSTKTSSPRIIADKIAALDAKIDIFKSYVEENRTIKAHDRSFVDSYKGYKIIGQQGCGDLTMNLWNVACVRTPPPDDSKLVLIYLHEEPLEKRTYSCLVKWRSKGEAGCTIPRYSIEDLRFNSQTNIQNEKVYRNREKRCCGDDIDFAVYGKQIMRDGEPIKGIGNMTHEFSDLRHLFQMPNLNPGQNLLFEGDTGRPRFYFGALQDEPIWLGEAQLLEHPNEQRQAYHGPVFISRLYNGMSCSEDQIKGAMANENKIDDLLLEEKYKEIKDPRESLEEGQFRFVPDDPMLVEIYFRHNTYSWSMIGLNKDKTKIFAMACEGDPGKSGYTLESAAKLLKDVGVYDALLIDEGLDVFQLSDIGETTLPRIKVADGSDLFVRVPSSDRLKGKKLARTRLRATFIFARQANC